jgi:hypothetical protein
VFRSKGEKSLARAATVAALVAALAMPAAAGAWSTNFDGQFSRGGTLSFKLKREQGKRKVSRWAWNKFPVTCTEGDVETTSHFSRKDLRVVNREFAGRAVLRNGQGSVIGKAKVDGEFGKGLEDAKGTFRVSGVLPDSDYTNCDSALQGWTASTVTPVR